MDDYRKDMAYQQTKQICQWHRFVGSEGEDKARRYIYGQFTELGIECQREPFNCSNFSQKILLRIFLCSMAGLLITTSYLYWSDLFLYSIIFAGILSFVSLITIIILFIPSIGSNIGTKIESENLIGYMKARNPRPKSTVFIMSHYDTKSQSFPLLLRIILFIVGLLGTIAVIFVILIFGLIQITLEKNYINGTILFYSSIAFFTCNILLLFNFTGNKSVGAMDNAAAIGVQIAIIRNLLDYPPENTDVYFLSTTAKEIGTLGAINFIKRHEKDFNKDFTYFLNFDIIGGKGKVSISNRFGIPPKKTSDEITKILLEIAREKNVKVNTHYLPFSAIADHMPFLRRRFKTSWIKTSSRKVTAKIHTPKDTIEIIDKESLRTAIILGFEFIQKIDRRL